MFYCKSKNINRGINYCGMFWLFPLARWKSYVFCLRKRALEREGKNKGKLVHQLYATKHLIQTLLSSKGIAKQDSWWQCSCPHCKSWCTPNINFLTRDQPIFGNDKVLFMYLGLEASVIPGFLSICRIHLLQAAYTTVQQIRKHQNY